MDMSDKNYYEVMGLTPQASANDIKHAYRRLARKYHPDLNKEKNAEEKFKELGTAYDVLRDTEKRKQYDQYLAAMKHRQAPFAHTTDEQRTYDANGFSGNEDLFEFIFGQNGFKRDDSVDLDLHSTVSITLEEAYHGVVKELQLKKTPHTPVSTFKVKIPANVRSGQKIRLSGQGAHIGNNQGDLYLTIHIAKHHLFDVKGDDIYLTLPVTPWEAALGATVATPTLAGKVDLRIPANAQGGQILRLKGRGLQGKVHGNQYVILKIVTPQPVTEADRALYQKMAQAMPFDPRTHMGD